MRMRTNNPRRVSYSHLVDLLNDFIDIQEAKGRNCVDTLADIKSNLEGHLSTIPNWKEKHINTQTVSLLERLVPKNVTPQQIYQLLKRFLEYRTDSTDFRRIQNVYTLLRYYENPKEMELFATNWKDIMKKTK